MFNISDGDLALQGSLGSLSLSDLTPHGDLYRERFTTRGGEALIFNIHKYISQRCQQTISLLDTGELFLIPFVLWSIQVRPAWSLPGAGMWHQGVSADGLSAVRPHPALPGRGGGLHPTFHPVTGCPWQAEGCDGGPGCEYFTVIDKKDNLTPVRPKMQYDATWFR